MASPDDDVLRELRDQIRELDLELIERAARRVELARRLGDVKRRLDLPVADYAQERRVLDRARTDAARLGLDSRVAEDLLAGLIRAAITVQDEDRLRGVAAGAGRRAVVVGGAGRMGRWLDRFLAAQGYRTHVLDPAPHPGGDDPAAARRALPDADLVVCCTPPMATVSLYDAWVEAPPSGVIVDIASIKTPLVEPIRRLQRAGGRVASIHPMFGPSIALLRDADVVVCDTGDHDAGAAVEALFEPTEARLVRLPLEEHDRLMADLLSLAHVSAIAFALACPQDEHPVRSTTFRALESLAATVVRESPDVYYEIQAMNPHSADVLDRLRAALDRIVEAVATRDAGAFATLLADGRRRTPDVPPAAD